MGKINKVKRQICRDIVAEDGGTLAEVEQIVESQFAFVKCHMEKGEFSTVRLPYLGKFHVRLRRLQMLNHAVIQRRKF
jgi:nucleoid DNA-binding protein